MMLHLTEREQGAIPALPSQWALKRENVSPDGVFNSHSVRYRVKSSGSNLAKALEVSSIKLTVT
jgi:hypothetical protein